MLRRVVIGIAVALLGASFGQVAQAAYDSPAATVLGSVVTEQGGTTTINAITGGFSGGSTGVGSGANVFLSRADDGMRSTGTGVSAGSMDGKLAMWINGAYSHFDEDQEAIDSDGDTYSISLGADWRFTERVVAGLSVGWETQDITTTFNQGNLDSDGYTIAPYVAVKLSDRLFFDAAVGYTQLETDADRITGGARVTGSYDSERMFAVANLTYLVEREKWNIKPGVGILWLDAETDAYTESGGIAVPAVDTQLGRGKAGARIEYTAHDRFTPYVTANLEYDFADDDPTVGAGVTQPSDEDLGAVLGLGATMRFSERATGTIEGSTVLGKSDFEQYNLIANMRFRF